MNPEEQLTEAMEEDDEESDIFQGEPQQAKQQKSKAAMRSFLGTAKQENYSVEQPPYYALLLAWALHTHIDRDQWQIEKTLGYKEDAPIYHDVSYSYDKKQKCIVNGQLFLVKDNVKLAVTIKLTRRSDFSVLITGAAKNKETVTEFGQSIERIIKNDNFYRGANFRLSQRPELLKVSTHTWDSVILDSATKDDIELNTTGFLKNTRRLAKLGVPCKRGVILSGSPGTGKTILCKALMAKSGKITCITTDPYYLDDSCYIRAVYEMAVDLKPSLVFIEDLDQIGQGRVEYGWRQAPALNTLLEVLDGVEENVGVVTIATTNSLDTLDEAIVRRPSRFDRIIQLPNPDLDKRQQLIGRLSLKARIDPEIQRYIACRTEHFTPAQLQEVVYSLAIECSTRTKTFTGQKLVISKDDVDRVIRYISHGRTTRMGFLSSENPPWDRLP